MYYAHTIKYHVAAKHIILVSLKNHSFCASLCPAIQKQKPPSSLVVGAAKAYFPMRPLLRRSVFFTDAGIKSHKISIGSQ